MHIRFNKGFSAFSRFIASISGRPGSFMLALGVIIIWGITGPFFSYSDTWQLVINTGTTIVTFLMVFLIQNTQNRDSEAVQIKLDELICSSENAHKALLDLEELTQDQLELIKNRYEKLARLSRAEMRYSKESVHPKNEP